MNVILEDAARSLAKAWRHRVAGDRPDHIPEDAWRTSVSIARQCAEELEFLCDLAVEVTKP